MDVTELEAGRIRIHAAALRPPPCVPRALEVLSNHASVSRCKNHFNNEAWIQDPDFGTRLLARDGWAPEHADVEPKAIPPLQAATSRQCCEATLVGAAGVVAHSHAYV